MENYGNKNQTKPSVFEFDLSIYTIEYLCIYIHIYASN